MSERVHERSESALSGGVIAGGSAVKSKYIPISPKSGALVGNSRVVTIKEQDENLNRGHLRGPSIQNMS